MSGFLQCLSHTPLIGLVNPAETVVEEIRNYTEKARQMIEDFDPELVVIFAPDHYNGFFHDVMPSFCVGIEAHAIGDFNTLKGPLSTASELATKLAELCIDHGVDIATSQGMQVDHGFSQPLGLLLGGIDRYPVIPIFINCIASPLPTFKRARILGKAVGSFCKMLNKRVLFLASGGLSHQPPIPEYSTASEDVRSLLLGAGKNLSTEAREARTNRTIDAAKQFVLDQTTLHTLAPEWDQDFIDTIANNRISAVDEVENQYVTEIAGASTHEVKTWVAAASAMSMMGPYESINRYYRPIPEWISGFGGLTARSLDEKRVCGDDVKASESTPALNTYIAIGTPVK
ncbi:2,3-dihydroxyphenylpropionate 1,2-dioxygenase [Exophiala aquamarina CBS 119918]|uniref:2,3-dihydroxyphenylpropionate 1,2-dioxygenase n=1 Tax=Exophiala aquamarina CBS 119918 TaxID=1182545 RepID=A0A072P348_9EURO|nr:2,3-dihydroxyphenylpropionate 1,2-dioxygenase [Exophiala aquamarina CBS 119918]KEF54127.1 2,3-dihydroxyphenylpropionate 1,2-dioxygenase [Exophiala aquamarina CBS 119918]